MWIELIGFDNAQPDYGVTEFLELANFAPEVLSFHFCCPDFVNDHAGMETEADLPPDVCSYGGRGYNAERPRQRWTNYQVRGLVQTLQAHGVAVYCSVMNVFQCHLDGRLYRSPWSESHPELWEVRHTGETPGCLNPLKRLADGSLYEDFFAARLREVMTDYGFAGFHAADGISSPRRPIWMSDYSDDMVSQFIEMMGLGSQFTAPVVCDGDPDRAEARARFIWQHLRHEWCEFYARRFASLHGKICAALHPLGKPVVLNNAWTQDPFDAYARYGVDYRRLVEAGVDAFILETVGAGNAIGAEGVFRDFRADYNLMLLFAKAHLPQTPMICLNCTGDTTENWDVLNHAPPVCEREHYSLGSMFLQDHTGLRRASSGPIVCLADGITWDQWRWMGKNWQVAYEAEPARALGATVLWSEAALAAEFDDYHAHRTVTRHKLASRLHAAGAPLLSAINVTDLEAAEGALFVPRPELLPAEELARVLARPGPVIMIGRSDAGLPPADLTLQEGPDPEQLCLRAYHVPEGSVAPTLAPETPAPLPDEIPEPPNYLFYLYMRPVGEPFLQACAKLLLDLTDAPVVVSDTPEARVWAYETTEGTLRLLIASEAYSYILPEIDVRRPLSEVRVLSHFPGKPVVPQGSKLSTRVPPRGMVVLEGRK